jgi:transcriptional regulator with XRE-family HTH domain
MTHFQDIFIRNLRFWRKKRGISQLKLSELIKISPNYLNAVENGKNFPSPEVIQNISDTLGIMPYQLFLEVPAEKAVPKNNNMIYELLKIEQLLNTEINSLIQKYQDK